MPESKRQTLSDVGLEEDWGRGGVGMGRVFVPDERDGDYPMSAVLENMEREDDVYQYWWDQGWRGNQGRTPQCVAYACLHRLEDGGMTHFYEERDFDPEYMNEGDEEKHQSLIDPVNFYKRAQQLDQWPGTDYSGTSVRAGMKVLQENGLIEEYRWAETFDDIVEAVLRQGPVLMGTLWYEGMLYPDSNNFIRAIGDRVGGHAYVLNGVNLDEKKFRLKNCYDEKTEILTVDGWKLISDVEEGEYVATLNPETHELEYQGVKETHHYDNSNDGELLHYTSRDVDLMVTPNHKIYNRKRDSRGTRRLWRLTPASEISVKHFHMKKDIGGWRGDSPDVHEVDSQKVPMDDWVEFMGYFLSEGYTSSYDVDRSGGPRTYSYDRYSEPQSRDDDTGRFIDMEGERETVEGERDRWNGVETHFTVGICQSPDSPSFNSIQNCLERLPFNFTWCKSSETWVCSKRSLHDELKDLGKAHEKYIPMYLKSLSADLLETLYQAMMLGDGSISEGQNGSIKRVYYTSSKRLADDFQEVLLKTGRCGDISYDDRRGRENDKGTTRHINWRVGIKETQTEPSPGCGWMPEKVEYDGTVHCVTVPNHIVYVRRNGKAVWSGNSWGESWGSNSSAWIRFEDIRKVFEYAPYGEACIASEVQNPSLTQLNG